jgi:hypothetical protein
MRGDCVSRVPDRPPGYSNFSTSSFVCATGPIYSRMGPSGNTRRAEIWVPTEIGVPCVTMGDKKLETLLLAAAPSGMHRTPFQIERVDGVRGVRPAGAGARGLR